MDLIHNRAIEIIDGDLKGIYRVILDEPSNDKTCLVKLDVKPTLGGQSKGGRKRLDNPKRPPKKRKPPNIGSLIWIERSILEEIDNAHLINHVDIEYRNITLKNQNKNKEKKEVIYKRRLDAMEPFLSFVILREHILETGNISSLVKLAIKNSGLSKSAVYTLFSILCRFGFTDKSLQTAFDECGAPGVARPCDPGGRAKAGRKTIKQRLAEIEGIKLAPDQPGICTDWTNRILAADSTIPTPKPPMPDRCTIILNKAFITTYRVEKSGELKNIDPELGSYPNKRQIIRVLEREIPRLVRLVEKTTNGHFDRCMRGLSGRAWEGVPGPGHTWAIDSTIGDIYLRSSINRAWIIGRPIVYIIVDVWSTAITGFYVCLQGPSWNMAKISLFCAGADPTLIESLWGYQDISYLDPLPTLPADLLCDRGEYLSHGARQTGMLLLPSESYTPPYRPDLKGLVEVLHRIEKDRMYFFTPGAIDARRKEYDLRKFDPNTAVFTLKEFVQYLSIIFYRYNYSANRKYRLEPHMKADGVIGTPAGLWNWGHKVGIGLRREISFTDLVTNLLPQAQASVTREGVKFGKRDYNSELVSEQQWTAHARNFGGSKIPANYFPGSASLIWTPNYGETGLIQLSLSDHSTASHELTWDEILDADKYYAKNNAKHEHDRSMIEANALREMQNIVDHASRLTKDAESRHNGEKPTLKEARKFENNTVTQGIPGVDSNASDDYTLEVDEAETAYMEAMRHLLESDEVEV